MLLSRPFFDVWMGQDAHYDTREIMQPVALSYERHDNMLVWVPDNIVHAALGFP